MKTLRKVLAIILVICMVMSLASLSVSAANRPGNGSGYEYIQIFINGESWKIISGSGDSWLIRGEYDTPVINLNGTTLSYDIGNQRGSVELPIPEGAENINISYNPTVSINSQSANYDNAKIYLTFTEVTVDNTVYHPGSTSISVTKAVAGEGAGLDAGQFTFTLTETDASWTPNGGYSATAANDAGGKVSFPSISYGTVGTYYYIVTETNDAQENWTYSDHVAQVTVNVIEGAAEGDNIFLWAGATYNNGGVFTNTYTKEVPPVEPPVEPPYEPVHTLGSLTLVKASSGAETPADALFTVSGPDGYSASINYSEFVNGSYTLNELTEGEYTVTESGADVDGFELAVSYSGAATLIKTDADNGDTNVSSGTITITNTYTEKEVPPPPPPATIDVAVEKLWVDNDNALELRPVSIEVQLYADGEPYGEPVSLNAENDWNHIWFELPMEAEYTVDELSVPAGYTKNVDGYTITNTLNSIVESGEPNLPDLTVNKTDAEGAALAGAVFTLAGEGYTSSVTSGADGKAVFADIPVGTYTLSETAAPEGYKAIDTTWAVEVTAEKSDYSINVGANGIINKVWNWIVGIFVDKEAKAEITVVNELLPVEPPVTPPVTPPVEEPEYGSLAITKRSSGAETPAATEFTVTGPNGYELVISYSDFVDGVYTIEELELGVYTITEGDADVEGYTLEVTGSGSNVDVAANETSNVLIVNEYTEIPTVDPPVDPPVIPIIPVIPTPDPEPDPDPDPEPEVPEVPEVPEEPEVPEVPEEPEIPDEPIDIPDDDVPLAPPPVIDLEDIPDEEVPLAQAPQTGDSFLFWLAAAVLSAIGLAYTSLKLRKMED